MRRLAALAIPLALAFATPARAQPAGDAAAQARNEASLHYARGVQAYGDGDFTLALAEFERAQAIAPNYRTLYNIGQVDQQLRRYVRARAALRQYVAEGGERIPADRRAEVERDLAALAAKVARVRVEVDVVGADVLLDDVRVGTTPLSEPLEIDAGEHRIVARAKGHAPDSQLLTLAGGDAPKVTLHLVPDAAPSAPQVQLMAPPTAPEAPASGPMWIGWTATGVLAAGALLTGAFALSSAGELDKLRRTPDSSPATREDVLTRARALAITTDVLAVSALAAGGVSLFLTLRSPASTHVGVGAQGVVFRGQF